MDDDSMTTEKPMRHAAQMQSAEGGDTKKSTKPNRLDRATRAKLGQQLRAVYDEVVSQGVPNRFTDLLARLENEGTQNAR
jgi:vancomycin resistance protein YoaR